MCRLAGYIGPPLPPAILLFGGEHSLEVQSYRPRELLHGHVNVDGFGASWYREGDDRPIRFADPRPPWHDPHVPRLLGSVCGSPILASVRNVTPGIPADRSGIAPLTLHRWSFVLNGFIHDFRKEAMRPLQALIPDDLYGELRGTSDTETLFLLFVHYAREAPSTVDALRALVAAALEVGGARGLEVQLNLLASDGEVLVATRMGSGRPQNSLYVRSGSDSKSSDGDASSSEEAFLGGPGAWIASEPLDASVAWEPVPEGSLVEAARDGSLRVAPLDTGG